MQAITLERAELEETWSLSMCARQAPEVPRPVYERAAPVHPCALSSLSRCAGPPDSPLLSRVRQVHAAT